MLKRSRCIFCLGIQNTSFVTLFLVIITSAYSQSPLTKIQGGIIDSLNNTPVSFANIILKKTGHGTCTNYAGKFILKIDSLDLSDTIKVSHIGFKTVEIPITSINLSDSTTIAISPQNTILTEVSVYSRDAAKKVVVEAFSKILNTYPNKRHYYSAFFREVLIQNNQANRLVEAALRIEDPGFRKNVKDVRVQVDQLRRSYDYSKTNAGYKIIKSLFGKSNSIYSIYESSNIRKYYYNRRSKDLIYGDKFFDLFDFYQTGETVIDSQKVFIVDYEKKGVRKKQQQDTSKRYFFSQGRLFITDVEYAIIRAEHWFGPILKPNSELVSSLLTDKQYSEKVVYEFRKHIDNKYYLSWIEKTEFITAGQYNQLLLYINEMPSGTLRRSKIKTRFLFAKDIDLYNMPLAYDEKFWDSYNSMLMNPIDAKTLFDIERIKPLKDQFRANKE
jgi:hypothetical protein